MSHPMWEHLANEISGILSQALAEIEEDGVVAVDTAFQLNELGIDPESLENY